MIDSIQNPVILFGDINMDVIMSVLDIPPAGHESFAMDIQHCIGGTMMNTAIVLSRLGQPVLPLGCVGHDQWSNWIFSNLSNETNIDLEAIKQRQEFCTGMNFIAVTPDGERTMFGYRGANVSITPSDIESFFQKDQVAGLYLSGYSFLQSPQKDTALYAIELAKKIKIPIFLDTALDPVLQYPALFHEVLQMTTVCVLGMKESTALFGENSMETITAKLHDYGNQLVSIKLGNDGCFLSNQTSQHLFPPFPVTSIDTTAAGDAFSAGLLYGFLRGFPLSHCGILANALGALATQVTGGGQNLPGRDDILSFFQELLHRPNSPNRQDIQYLHEFFSFFPLD